MSINIFHAYLLPLSNFYLINILLLYLCIFWRFNFRFLILRLILGIGLNLIKKKLIDSYNSFTHLLIIHVFRNQSVQLQIAHLTRLMPNQPFSCFFLLPATKHIFLDLFLILLWLIILIGLCWNLRG